MLLGYSDSGSKIIMQYSNPATWSFVLRLLESQYGTMATKYSVVVAVEKNKGIGYKGDIPWPRLS